MIKNIEIPRPFQRNIKFSFGEVEFDSNVLDAVEMDDRVVVQLSNKNNSSRRKNSKYFLLRQTLFWPKNRQIIMESPAA